MAVIDRIAGLLGAAPGNVLGRAIGRIRTTVESGGGADTALRDEALRQLAAGLAKGRLTRFGRLVKEGERLPGPALALGTVAMFASAVLDPVGFSERMAGLEQVPEPLWWLLGAVVSLYLGMRHHRRGRELQHDLAMTIAQAPEVIEDLDRLQDLGSRTGALPAGASGNPALDDWQALRTGA
ncbi:3TM-type holin [Pontibaca methylaminivorans]|uniref:Holin of 3TMs, for gene-transfer release n=1 Tax=Pontibaca methylaminivorans TaxID=515897 RepID=A0A1R3W7L0_9RHOB|nr:3TM-type holin [Pontibaca methylaminivorans]SIT73896.1 Holin of 3TMs, for gene-transfer release [Pontibaca methylaminivorans]